MSGWRLADVSGRSGAFGRLVSGASRVCFASLCDFGRGCDGFDAMRLKAGSILTERACSPPQALRSAKTSPQEHLLLVLALIA